MKKFFDKIKALFNKLTNWFAGVLQENDEFVKVYAPLAVNILNFIKEYNGSAIVSALKSWVVTLGGTYAKIGVELVDTIFTDDNMNRAIAALNISYDAASTPNVSEKLKFILDYVRQLETDERAIAWTELSAMIAASLTDGKLSWQEVYSIVKAIYDTKANL
jgi:hypothetical protein